MNCYSHPAVPATGLCKTCFKALCPECSVDVGNGLACRGECEEKVRELNEMSERSARIYGIGRHKSRIPATGVLLWGIVALVLWSITGFGYFVLGEIDVVIIVLALFFTLALGLAIYSARRTGLNC